MNCVPTSIDCCGQCLKVLLDAADINLRTLNGGEHFGGKQSTENFDECRKLAVLSGWSSTGILTGKYNHLGVDLGPHSCDSPVNFPNRYGPK